MKLTAEAAKIRCDDAHPENDHSELNFTGTRNQIIVICPEHGKFEITFCNYASPSSKKNCIKCGKGVVSLEKFKALCDKYHPENDHSELNFTGTNKSITPICPIHGKWTAIKAASYALPNVKTGCPTCNKITPKIFKARCDKSQPQNDHSKLGFTGLKNPVTPICPIHGQWTVNQAGNYGSPNSKSGCPNCADFGFKPYLLAFLYFFKIDGLWKVGITNNPFENRYTGRDKDRMTEIHIIEYAIGQEALDEETRIKKTYAPFQTKRTDRVLSCTKNTELFEIDLYREIYGTKNRKQVG